MALKFFGNVKKLETEIEATDAALQSDCEKADIKTAQRDGKVISITEATISEKYAALRAAHPPGTNLEERAELLASNGLIASRCEKAETDLALEKTTTSTLTRENASLKTALDTEKASVATLTAEKANQINLRDAAVNENNRLQKELNGLNGELSRRCLAANCLMDLRDENGAPLAANATPEAKQEAADRIPAGEKLTALCGAVNATLAKLGVDLSRLPSGGARLSHAESTGILAQYNAITNAAERTAFYRKNSAAIDAAHRAQKSH
jgi:hypothetical protein